MPSSLGLSSPQNPIAVTAGPQIRDRILECPPELTFLSLCVLSGPSPLSSCIPPPWIPVIGAPPPAPAGSRAPEGLLEAAHSPHAAHPRVVAVGSQFAQRRAVWLQCPGSARKEGSEKALKGPGPNPPQP